MAWVSREGRYPGFTWFETVTAGNTSDALKIPHTPPGREISVTAIPGGGGTAKVQFTTSPDADVVGATATWQDWPLGDISSTASDRILSQVTALRFVATTANADFEVVI
jgi:hypothetical protein